MNPHHLQHAVLEPVRTSPTPEVPPLRLPLPSLRGLIVGLLAVGLGLLVMLTSGSALASGDLAVLSMLFMGALIGGSAADRMADRRQAALQPKGWMTVIISSHGPSQPQPIETGPRVSPRRDPERRSLTRLARQKRRDSVSASV